MSTLQVLEWTPRVAKARSVFVIHTKPVSKKRSAEELHAAMESLEVQRLTLSVDQLQHLTKTSRPPEGFSADTDW
jgi:hypothetical protein